MSNPFRGVSAPALMAGAAAVIMAVLTGVAALGSTHVGGQEVVQVIIAAVGAFNVWAAANLPGYEHMKKYVAAVTVVLQALFTVIVGGVSTLEWVNLGITALAALGVALVPHPLTVTTNEASGRLAPITDNQTAPRIVVLPGTSSN